jgi:putative NADH-flavin reductase
MRIALIGATGFIGSKILTEAAGRGHTVTAICRHPEKVPALDGVKTRAADVSNPEAIADAVASHDIVVHACAPPREMEMAAKIAAQTAITTAIIEAVKTRGIPRIMAVGGAGTLLIDGVPFLDRPEFPKQFEGGARATAVIKELLQEEHDFDWTVLCPSTMVVPGERTGKYRLDFDDLIVMADGTSKISVEDYALAFINEIENPQYTGHRFTVGY